MLTLNDFGIHLTKFPDGTSQVWKLPRKALQPMEFYDGIQERMVKGYLINWYFKWEEELIQLGQLVELINDRIIHYIAKGTDKRLFIYLRMTFLPYGRQDKKVSNQTTFALQPFSHYLNSLNLDQIEALDVHNPERTENLIKNFYNISPRPYLQRAIDIIDPDVILFPDESAEQRYIDKIEHDSEKIRYFIAMEKDRNPINGQVLSLNINQNNGMYFRQAVLNNPELDVLIVDDICDGGATFIRAAQLCQTFNVPSKNVHLYVTHGLFTKGKPHLRRNGINRIFTKDGER